MKSNQVTDMSNKQKNNKENEQKSTKIKQVKGTVTKSYKLESNKFFMYPTFLYISESVLQHVGIPGLQDGVPVPNHVVVAESSIRAGL